MALRRYGFTVLRFYDHNTAIPQRHNAVEPLRHCAVAPLCRCAVAPLNYNNPYLCLLSFYHGLSFRLRSLLHRNIDFITHPGYD